MRIRHFASLALLLPAVVGAQSAVRRPRIGGGAPRPAALPPGLSNRQYIPWRVSFEAYPTYNFLAASQFVGSAGPQHWSMLGTGGRLDYRLTNQLSLTGDGTAAYFGAPFIMFSVEPGLRFHPFTTASVRPWLDARGTWEYLRGGLNPPPDGLLVIPATSYNRDGIATSHGFGMLVGTGFDVPVTQSLTFTSGVSVSRASMVNVRVGGMAVGSEWNYRAVNTRLTFGLRYNPGRLAPRP